MRNEIDPRASEWFALHVSGGGEQTWEQISEGGYTDERGAPLSGNAIRKRVRKWKESATEPPYHDKEAVQRMFPLEQTVEVVDPVVLPENWLDDLWENAKEQARLRLQTEKEETVFHVRVP
jgi:hypothetical protein